LHLHSFNFLYRVRDLHPRCSTIRRAGFSWATLYFNIEFACGVIKLGVYSVTLMFTKKKCCKLRNISVKFVFIGVIQCVQLNTEPTHTVYKPVHICFAARLLTKPPPPPLRHSDSQIPYLRGISCRRADDIICCSNTDYVPGVQYSLSRLKHFLRHIYRCDKKSQCYQFSGNTMGLGMTQPLIEMSTRIISWGL